MEKQLFVFTFPLWKRDNNLITSDAKVTASTQREAAEKLWADGVDKDWIIGDCRHCAYA